MRIQHLRQLIAAWMLTYRAMPTRHHFDGSEARATFRELASKRSLTSQQIAHTHEPRRVFSSSGNSKPGGALTILSPRGAPNRLRRSRSPFGHKWQWPHFAPMAQPCAVQKKPQGLHLSDPSCNRDPRDGAEQLQLSSTTLRSAATEGGLQATAGSITSLIASKGWTAAPRTPPSRFRRSRSPLGHKWQWRQFAPLAQPRADQ